MEQDQITTPEQEKEQEREGGSPKVKTLIKWKWKCDPEYIVTGAWKKILDKIRA